MKKALVAASVAAIVGVAGAANAADLYHSAGGYKDAPVVIAPTWTGFYIGASIGGAWADIKTDDPYGYFNYYSHNYGWTDSVSGFLGGGQVGYNWQSGAFVFGVELDLDGISLSNDNHPWLTSMYWRNNNDNGVFLFDATARLGYAVGPALLYIKGGYAYIDANVNLNYYGSSSSYYDNNSSNGLSGWTIGGGVEYMVSPSWSLKAEYLYYDFGKETQSLYCSSDKYDPIGHDVTINTFKVGLNYHIGSVYTPLK